MPYTGHASKCSQPTAKPQPQLLQKQTNNNNKNSCGKCFSPPSGFPLPEQHVVQHLRDAWLLWVTGGLVINAEEMPVCSFYSGDGWTGLQRWRVACLLCLLRWRVDWSSKRKSCLSTQMTRRLGLSAEELLVCSVCSGDGWTGLQRWRVAYLL